ncbi:MAG: LacI family DNA-binding transcriptional regulator [Yoonia sp.]|jgi:DNA-binding LacI/PurR family transcriptional regulator|nr:LacI family DNA-binding transcriptional regulator [Yoonia sp.]MDG1521426.1 LacI family DNA-binding transcriptional regulator [Yoonia sp.]MDG1769622.1 LacI family DNA-binding transcriptional regulator [Yoonia sp.]MDG1868147.1 LacI family DNA-binding transcriptional regulator [Yoonia sp.]
MGVVTSLQVAELAGVSQSAVSRVFTPGASASAKTVEKVKRAAAELGYRPNMMARAMITGKSRIIGLVVAYLDNQFYPLALERLSNALQAKGYHILVFTASNDNDHVARVLQELIDYQVEGIITASVGMSSALTERCADAGIPVVMFNRGQDGAHISSVTSANREGGAKVAEFLLSCGHQNIAHIGGWQGSSTGRDRQLGFSNRLEVAGITPRIVDGMYDREVARAATLDLMDRRSPPDAIFVGNDHMAFAVMDCLRGELGLSVPDDVAVVGYDDVPMASWAAYSLTTMRQPLNRMVDATVDRLMTKIEDKSAPDRAIEIESALIQRQSSRQPKGHDQ